MTTTDSTIEPLPSTECNNMDQVRAGVDWVDRQLVALLQCRFGYMDAAARIKPDRAAVRDQWRKDDVHAKVKAEAERLGLPADRLWPVWEELMEQSIAYEFEKYDAGRS
nr:chorismate mutase [uncultured Sphingomonas sp.]